MAAPKQPPPLPVSLSKETMSTQTSHPRFASRRKNEQRLGPSLSSPTRDRRLRRFGREQCTRHPDGRQRSRNATRLKDPFQRPCNHEACCRRVCQPDEGSVDLGGKTPSRSSNGGTGCEKGAVHVCRRQGTAPSLQPPDGYTVSEPWRGSLSHLCEKEASCFQITDSTRCWLTSAQGLLLR